MRAGHSVAAFLTRYGYLSLPLLACCLSFFSSLELIGPVLNRAGDDLYHVLNEYALAHAARVGDDVFGPLGMEFGQPVLRFYQCLFYLWTVGWSVFAGADLRLMHCVTIVVCFSLSPFAYCYFLRKLGLGDWAAAIGSLASLTSVAAFGNSFEAYYQAGIVTQSVGGLFLPWFMGSFIGMLRGENRAAPTALLFALAFLSHAIMSVFAVFCGALYFAVAPVSLRLRWRKIVGFAVLGAALVAFWVLPFIAHTMEMRPVPDSIVRGAGVHWFTSVSRDELAMVMFSGRLLDDPPVKHNDQKDPRDKLMDRINIIGTLKTRPPLITLFTGLGLAVALLGFRRMPYRFLAGGLAFSLMLFAGPDDFQWLAYLPFIKQIQTFRCTYMAEFFAFGLVGLGLETAGRGLWRFARRRAAFVRRPMYAAWLLLAGGGLAWVSFEILSLSGVHVDVREPGNLDQMVDACSTLPNRGYPYRIDAVYDGAHKIRHAWLVAHGYQAYCTHWKGTGPTSAFHLCTGLDGAPNNRDLYALAGIRYFSGQMKKVGQLLDAKDTDGMPVFERLPNGKDRKGVQNAWHNLLDNEHDSFLRPVVGRPLPVVSSHEQWVWMSRSWTNRYRRWIWERTTPIPMRVEAGRLAESGLLGQKDVSAIFYFNHSRLDRDLPALRDFAARGGTIVTPVAIPGVRTTLVAPKTAPWDALPATFARDASAVAEADHHEEQDPGLENASIRLVSEEPRRFQYFSYDVDLFEPSILILPMERAPGWNATLDGRPLPTFPSGPDMTGVYVGAGAHRVVFHWDMPAWHRALIWVSLGALAAVLGLCVTSAVRRRRGGWA
jgi:hypothetical protein